MGATLAQLARASGPGAVAAVEAVVARCGERRTMLEAEYAPLIATDRAAAIDAAGPTLEPALDDFVQAHEVVMMHEARPQVAGGKAGHEAAAVACLDAKDKIDLENARREYLPMHPPGQGLSSRYRSAPHSSARSNTRIGTSAGRRSVDRAA